MSGVFFWLRGEREKEGKKNMAQPNRTDIAAENRANRARNKKS